MSGPQTIQTFSEDFDGDGKPDQILFQRLERLDVGGLCFDHLSVRLSKSGVFELASNEGWNAPETALRPLSNLIGSELAFMNRFGPAGFLLFLSEAGSGGYAPGLTIVALQRGGAFLYFQEGECVWHLEREPGIRSWFLVEQPGLREMLEDPEDTRGCSYISDYMPTLVYRLGRHAVIDEQRTRAENTRLYGGYAGLKGRDDVLIVEPKEGKPCLRYLRPRTKPGVAKAT